MDEKFLARGVWCVTCELFEDDEYRDVTDDGARCNGCGCPESEHSRAKVVAE